MTAGDDQEPPQRLSSTTIDLAIRVLILVLLGYWSFRVIAPFVTIGLWSARLPFALYPLFKWLTWYLRPSLAATLVTLLCLLLVVGPVTWLGFGMVSAIGSLVMEINSGQPAIPLPPEIVKTWPLIGDRLHQLWSLAADNLKVALAEVAPMLKPVGGK